jgi:hypothetical protein
MGPKGCKPGRTGKHIAGAAQLANIITTCLRNTILKFESTLTKVMNKKKCFLEPNRTLPT